MQPLPPGQKETDRFPVLDLGIRPRVPEAEWTLEVGGAVASPLRFTWPEFSALPAVEVVRDFHCVTTWSKRDCRWTGVRFTEIESRARPHDEARYVLFTAYDGYTTNLPREHLQQDDVILATRFEGKPLTPDHGAPLRVIVPHLYAWKGAKFLRRIEFLTENVLGYWERRGYSDSADPWKEERYR